MTKTQTLPRYAHIAEFADKIVELGPHDCRTQVDGNTVWTTDGDLMWDLKRGGEAYSVAEAHNDTKNRRCIIMTAESRIKMKEAKR